MVMHSVAASVLAVTQSVAQEEVSHFLHACLPSWVPSQGMRSQTRIDYSCLRCLFCAD